MLVWIDLETTGLDETAESAQIIELSMIVTNDQADFELAEFSQVCGLYEEAELERGAEEMHHHSGLLQESLDSDLTVLQVQQNAVEWLRGFNLYAPEMCGSSVHFDRQWLRLHMPKLYGMFGHRNLDASSFWIYAARQGVKFERRESKHRGLDDIRDSIRLLHTAETGLALV